METIIIKNFSKQKMQAIYEYLAGYTTRLQEKIEVSTEVDKQETFIIIKDKK